MTTCTACAGLYIAGQTCPARGDEVHTRGRRKLPASTITLPDGTSVVAGDGANFGIVTGSRSYQIRRSEVKR